MIHERTRRSTTGDHAHRPQAVRARRRRRREGGRFLPALTGALLFASVALVGQAVRVEAGAPTGRPVAEVVELAAGPVDAHQQHEVDPTGGARQGGDLADATEATAERSSADGATGPVRPTVWYRLAAAEYGLSPQLLEALHQVESNASPDACIANLEGSGATGPFQFKPATFARFGVDANHDGRRDICGFVDSLFSAARYLRAIGADGDPTSAASRRALARYGTDVERVVSLARAYRERDGLVALAPVRVHE